MTFEFRAHRPSAYKRFAVFLVIIALINIYLISVLYPYLKAVNSAAERSIIFIFPWLFLLILPSAILGIIIYRSFTKAYRITIEPLNLRIDQLKNKSVHRTNMISWSQLKEVRVVDFEDNHYCNLEFADKKNNLVIHRESGDFENFYDELMKHTQ